MCKDREYLNTNGKIVLAAKVVKGLMIMYQQSHRDDQDKSFIKALLIATCLKPIQTTGLVSQSIVGFIKGTYR